MIFRVQRHITAFCGSNCYCYCCRSQLYLRDPTMTSVFHNSNNSIDSETHHHSESCAGIFSIQWICPNFDFTIPNSLNNFSESALQYHTPTLSLPGTAAPGIFCFCRFLRISRLQSSCISVLAHFTTLVIQH